jgi:hypothetical protein
MDDAYAIDLAKTEIREAYNTADPDRLLAVVDEGLIDFSDHRQTGYSQGGKAAHWGLRNSHDGLLWGTPRHSIISETQGVLFFCWTMSIALLSPTRFRRPSNN